ncbi:pilus assembly protein PilM [Lachnospiraceae bacterium ZAX-1]
MANNPLVIELGERSIRVCRPVRTKEGKVEKLDMGSAYTFPMPSGVVDDGQVTNPSELGNFIKNNLRTKNVKAKEVTFVLNSSKIVTREALLPPVAGDRKLKELVASNVGEYFPIDLSNYRLGYTVIGKTEPQGEDGLPKLRVLVIAVPTELLDSYTELAKVAGLKMKSFDYAGNSQCQVFKELNAPDVTMYAYIDHQSSYMTFMSGRDILLQRTLSFGGGEMIEDYLAKSGYVGEEAYQSYHAVLSELSQAVHDFPPMPDEQVEASFGRLAVGIERSLRYYNTKYSERAVSKVVLAGPLARLYHLREVVENELGLSVELMTEQPEAAQHIKNVGNTLPFLACLGASIESLGLLQTKVTAKRASIGNINEEKADIKVKYTINGGVVVLAVAVIASVVLILFGYFQLTTAKHEKKNLEDQIANTLYAEEIYNDYLVYQSGADASANLVASIVSPNDDLKAFFEELEQKMPSEILLLSVSCTKEGITMNITVPTKTDVARVMVQLREFASLGHLLVPALTEPQNELGNDMVAFSAYFEYNTTMVEIEEQVVPGSDVEEDLETYDEQGGATQ